MGSPEKSPLALRAWGLIHQGRWRRQPSLKISIARSMLQCSTQPKGYAMECTVSWTGATGAHSDIGFIAETGSGHVIAMDGAPDADKPENGGRNLAPRPMETVLAGTG